jgi:signal transduction histidine kinase
MSDSTIALRHATTAFVGADRRMGATGVGRRAARVMAAALALFPLALAFDAAWVAGPTRGPGDPAWLAAGLGGAFALSGTAAAALLTSYRTSGRARDLWMAFAFGFLTVCVVLDVVLPLLLAPASLCVLVFGVRAAFGPVVDTRVTAAHAAMIAVIGLALGAVLLGAASVLTPADELPVLSGETRTGWWASTLVTSLAAGVAIIGVLRGLSAGFASRSQELLVDHVHVAASEDMLRTQQSRTSEREHDLLTGLLAIEAAVAGLPARTGSGDHTQPIATGVSIEIERLRRMLTSPADPCPARVVRDVRVILAAVLLLERARNPYLTDRLAADAATDVPADVLVRVVQVLLDNARRHAPGAHVEVTSRRCGDRVEITVRDDGRSGEPGVASSHGARPPSGAERCHGVGLLGGRRLIEEHGGSLHVVARVRGGMAFTIDVPVTGSSDRVTVDDRNVAMFAGRRRTDNRPARVRRSAAA